MLGASHNEAVSALREAGDSIQLLVCDGWNTPTPRTPEPDVTSADDHIDATEPQYNKTAPNGEVNSTCAVVAGGSDLAERPPSANQEKVCAFLCCNAKSTNFRSQCLIVNT